MAQPKPQKKQEEKKRERYQKAFPRGFIENAVMKDILEAEDHYAALKIPYDMSLRKIKKAYRQLALKIHSDKCKHKDAEKAFQRVVDAYKCLSDPSKRRQYDQDVMAPKMGRWSCTHCFRENVPASKKCGFCDRDRDGASLTTLMTYWARKKKVEEKEEKEQKEREAFKVGERVILQLLRKKKELNGQHATVTVVHTGEHDEGRVTIKTDSGVVRRKLKSRFLRREDFGKKEKAEVLEFKNLTEQGKLELITNFQNRFGLRDDDLVWHLYLKELTDKDCLPLGHFMSSNTSITGLYLNGNQIGDFGALAISKAIKVNNVLVELEIDENLITDAGAQSLGKALKVNDSISWFSVAKNQIQDNGVWVIGKALEKNTTLTKLCLKNNNFGDDGCEMVGIGLGQNSSITEIDLSYNQVRNTGSQAVFNALITNTTLTVLWFTNNQIGDVGTEQLADALRINTTLTHLHLNSNQMGDGVALYFAGGIKNNKGLIWLDLMGCSFSHNGKGSGHPTIKKCKFEYPD